MTNQQPAITTVLNEAVAQQFASNRMKLVSIMKTLILCGLQNISLRGHHNSNTDIERDVGGLQNHGNFMALLNFRVDAGDTMLRDHLTGAP